MKYDFKKVRTILNNEKNIVIAYLGIDGYWMHTAEIAFENSKIKEPLEDIGKSLDMVNITYGTPTLEIEYSNGIIEMIEVGDNK